MMKAIGTIGILILVFSAQVLHGQTATKAAIALAKEKKAIQYLNAGRYEESIQLLRDCRRLDPDVFRYVYELADAFRLMKYYDGTIRVLEKNKSHKNVSDSLYVLLGSTYYHELGKPAKANAEYDEGLAKFPNSGRLYYEKGNILFDKKEYINAVTFFEKGIEVDPKYPSNYYLASRIYCGSSEEVWGMIYGELFINLETNTDRTNEIGKMLFDTYKSQITLVSDSLFTVSFSSSNTMSIKDIKDPVANKLPYGFGVYEPTLLVSLLGAHTIDINSLDIIRGNFLSNYIKNGYLTNFPNILFDYQKKVRDAGHLEAYNHWILMKGDEGNFNAWQSTNKNKWDSFIRWFSENSIKLDQTNKFYRGQYPNK